MKHQRHDILPQGPFATAAELLAANEAGELTHCSAGWGARDYDSSWASTSRLQVCVILSFLNLTCISCLCATCHPGLSNLHRVHSWAVGCALGTR
jgi:hypothetical protein